MTRASPRRCLLVEDDESAPLADVLQSDTSTGLVASWLLHTELHCAARRHPEVVDSDAVPLLLGTVTLVDLTRGDLLSAGSLAGGLRSNDAVHLAVALRVGPDSMITYDRELQDAASGAGLDVLRPGPA